MWTRFFFAPRDVRPLAVMRICVGAVVAWMLLERIPVASAAFSDAGWVPRAAAVQLMDKWHWSVFHFIDAPWQVVALLAVGAAAAAFFCAGLLTRPMGIVAFVVLVSMHVRNPTVLYGADSVARIWLLYLLLMPCGRAWSFDAIRGRVRAGVPAFLSRTPTMEAWPVRLLQIQVALIYLATGISKYYGTDYHDGMALWYALANPTFSRFYPMAEPLFVAGLPVLRALTLVTLWWELAFAFMFPFRRLRPVALGVGVLVHGGILVMMQIQFWGPLMLISYLSYLNGRRFHGLWLRHVRETRERRWDDRLRFQYDPADPGAAAVTRRMAALDAYGLIALQAVPGRSPRWVRRTTDEDVPPPAARAAVLRLLPVAARPWLRAV